MPVCKTQALQMSERQGIETTTARVPCVWLTGVTANPRALGRCRRTRAVRAAAQPAAAVQSQDTLHLGQRVQCSARLSQEEDRGFLSTVRILMRPALRSARRRMNSRRRCRRPGIVVAPLAAAIARVEACAPGSPPHADPPRSPRRWSSHARPRHQAHRATAWRWRARTELEFDIASSASSCAGCSGLRRDSPPTSP